MIVLETGGQLRHHCFSRPAHIEDKARTLVKNGYCFRLELLKETREVVLSCYRPDVENLPYPAQAEAEGYQEVVLNTSAKVEEGLDALVNLVFDNVWLDVPDLALAELQRLFFELIDDPDVEEGVKDSLRSSQGPPIVGVWNGTDVKKLWLRLSYMQRLLLLMPAARQPDLLRELVKTPV